MNDALGDNDLSNFLNSISQPCLESVYFPKENIWSTDFAPSSHAQDTEQLLNNFLPSVFQCWSVSAPWTEPVAGSLRKKIILATQSLTATAC